MVIAQSQLREFNQAFGIEQDTIAGFLPSPPVRKCRTALITEEYREYIVAEYAGDVAGVADALTDLLYVILGTYEAYGLEAEPFFDEVHRSNMTKLWTLEEVSTVNEELMEVVANKPVTPTGRCFIVRRKSDLKIMKPPGYSPADIAGEIETQRNISLLHG